VSRVVRLLLAASIYAATATNAAMLKTGLKTSKFDSIVIQISKCSPGVNVMITSVCDFGPICGLKNCVFLKKDNVMIQISQKN
jgi:hypothetical protein